jgi:perosamine synthetase
MTSSYVRFVVARSHPISNKVGERGLWLPSVSQLKDEEIDLICINISRFN